MVIGGCCCQNHSSSLQHALCVLQLCQKMLCMNNLGSCGLFPVSGLNFKTPQDVWQNTLSKCWKRAYTAAPRVNRLVHTRSSRDREEMLYLVFSWHQKNLKCLPGQERWHTLCSPAECRAKLLGVFWGEFIHSFWGAEMQDLTDKFPGLCCAERHIRWT